TNAETVYVALPNNRQRRAVLRSGLDCPFGYLLVDPGGPERILTGVYADYDLLDELRAYFDISDDSTAVRPRVTTCAPSQRRLPIWSSRAATCCCTRAVGGRCGRTSSFPAGGSRRWERRGNGPGRGKGKKGSARPFSCATAAAVSSHPASSRPTSICARRCSADWPTICGSSTGSPGASGRSRRCTPQRPCTGPPCSV